MTVLYGYYHNQKIAGYTLVNASLGYTMGAVTIRVWGRNLGSKDYAVHGLYFANDARKGYVQCRSTTSLVSLAFMVWM